MDRIAQIKQLYYEATPATVTRHLAKAITILKDMPTEEERERAAVYMDGLSQMRSEWAATEKAGGTPPRPANRRAKQ